MEHLFTNANYLHFIYIRIKSFSLSLISNRTSMDKVVDTLPIACNDLAQNEF